MNINAKWNRVTWVLTFCLLAPAGQVAAEQNTNTKAGLVNKIKTNRDSKCSKLPPPTPDIKVEKGSITCPPSLKAVERAKPSDPNCSPALWEASQELREKFCELWGEEKELFLAGEKGVLAYSSDKSDYASVRTTACDKEPDPSLSATAFPGFISADLKNKDVLSFAVYNAFNAGNNAQYAYAGDLNVSWDKTQKKGEIDLVTIRAYQFNGGNTPTVSGECSLSFRKTEEKASSVAVAPSVIQKPVPPPAPTPPAPDTKHEDTPAPAPTTKPPTPPDTSTPAPEKPTSPTPPVPPAPDTPATPPAKEKTAPAKLQEKPADSAKAAEKPAAEAAKKEEQPKKKESGCSLSSEAGSSGVSAFFTLLAFVPLLRRRKD